MNPTDTRTLISFVPIIVATIGLPKHLVANVGYTSEKNYGFILDKTETISIIPHQDYLKKYGSHIIHNENIEMGLFVILKYINVKIVPMIH